MNIFIITGASKGIGFELSKQLQKQGKKVIGIARTNPENNDNFVIAELTDTNRLESLLSDLIDEQVAHATSFTLVNNAGMVDPIGTIGTVRAKDIEKALALNLTAPIVLVNTFIAKLKEFNGKKRIVNISSGAGRNPYEGWGTYCTSKAGLDHFSKVVSMEQQNADYPVKIVSIAPGIIDTAMQETIRASDKEAFPLLDRFIDYKEQGQLSSAEETAQKLIAFMTSEQFEKSPTLADLRDY